MSEEEAAGGGDSGGAVFGDANDDEKNFTSNPASVATRSGERYLNDGSSSVLAMTTVMTRRQSSTRLVLKDADNGERSQHRRGGSRG